jgi:hypothetical protein
MTDIEAGPVDATQQHVLPLRQRAAPWHAAVGEHPVGCRCAGCQLERKRRRALNVQDVAAYCFREAGEGALGTGDTLVTPGQFVAYFLDKFDVLLQHDLLDAVPVDQEGRMTLADFLAFVQKVDSAGGRRSAHALKMHCHTFMDLSFLAGLMYLVGSCLFFAIAVQGLRGNPMPMGMLKHSNGVSGNATAHGDEDGSGPDVMSYVAFVATVAYTLGSIGFFDLSIKSHLAMAHSKTNAEHQFYNQLMREAKRQSAPTSSSLVDSLPSKHHAMNSP